MKSVWKGHLKFGMLVMPVKLFNAVETTENIKFNQLHSTDNGPIGYDKKCKKCETVVPADQIVKGFATGKESWVIITQDDIDSAKIKSSKVIEIEVFVDRKELGEVSFEAPYYLGPDGDVGTESYALLRQALVDTEKAGVGKIVTRDREDLIAILPYENSLAAIKLRYPAEVRNTSGIPGVDKVIQPSAEKRALARSLVESMAGDLDQIEMVDRYAVNLRKRIEAKIAGAPIPVAEKVEEEKSAVDIMAALKASIDAAKTKPKAARASKKK